MTTRKPYSECSIAEREQLYNVQVEKELAKRLTLEDAKKIAIDIRNKFAELNDAINSAFSHDISVEFDKFQITTISGKYTHTLCDIMVYIDPTKLR